MNHKNTLIFCLAFSFIFVSTGLFSQEVADEVASKNSGAVPQKEGDSSIKTKVFFKPRTTRDPFLSKEESVRIEAARLAEQRKIEEERREQERQARQRQAELERQKLIEEEIRRNPAREIMNKLTIDGILGTEAIVNGQIVRKGTVILGAKVTRISENSVTFSYKGQSFVRKLPLM